MRIDVITLFPELITPYTQHGIINRAFAPQDTAANASNAEARIALHLHNPRDFADGNYRRIDDRPYGGGPGMVMMAEPLQRCVEHIHKARALEQRTPHAPLIYFSPIGAPLHHDIVAKHANAQSDCILLCGRYEGVDQRFLDQYVDHYISLGDFVLSGGEIAAVAYLDAVARLLPGILGEEQSHIQDSFNPALSGILDAPHYTRPEVWNDDAVPEVLRSGDHRRIQAWRDAQSKRITEEYRPDLLPDNKPPKHKPPHNNG